MRMELQGNCLESSLPVSSPPVLTSPMQYLITTSCNDQMLLLAYKIITWNFALETLLQCVLECTLTPTQSLVNRSKIFWQPKIKYFPGRIYMHSPWKMQLSIDLKTWACSLHQGTRWLSFSHMCMCTILVAETSILGSWIFLIYNYFNCTTAVCILLIQIQMMSKVLTSCLQYII